MDRQTDRLVLPVSRTVHGLKGEDLLLHLEGEHVLAVVLPVARSLPQFAVVNVWSDHFLEAPLPVFTLRCRNTTITAQIQHIPAAFQYTFTMVLESL